MIGDAERARLGGGFEDFHIRDGFARRNRLVIIHAAIDHANQHRHGAELRVVEMIVALRVAFCFCYRLHAALQLN